MGLAAIAFFAAGATEVSAGGNYYRRPQQRPAYSRSYNQHRAPAPAYRASHRPYYPSRGYYGGGRCYSGSGYYGGGYYGGARYYGGDFGYYRPAVNYVTYPAYGYEPVYAPPVYATAPYATPYYGPAYRAYVRPYYGVGFGFGYSKCGGGGFSFSYHR